MPAPDLTIVIVLAAGAGKRFGGPKALIPWPGQGGAEVPLGVAHLIARAECARRILVVRTEVAAALAPLALPPGASLCLSSADDALGPAGSIAAELAELDREEAPALDDDTLLMITPVDCPPARAETVRALLARLGAVDRPMAARPIHSGRRGHPVVIRLGAAREAYRAPSPPSLRDLLRALGDRAVDQPVDDPNVLVDFDSAGDLARFRAGTPSC